MFLLDLFPLAWHPCLLLLIGKKIDPGRRRSWWGESWTQHCNSKYVMVGVILLDTICASIVTHLLFFVCKYLLLFFCSRVVAKAKVEKCPSHSSVCSEFWGWSNCSAKEKAFEPSSGLLSSPSRSVQRRARTSHHAKGFLQYVHLQTPLFYSPQALPYVGLLIAMIFFIYAVIGMQVSLSSIGAFKRFSSHQMEFIN